MTGLYPKTKNAKFIEEAEVEINTNINMIKLGEGPLNDNMIEGYSEKSCPIIKQL